jgi:hypothetical protein
MMWKPPAAGVRSGRRAPIMRRRALNCIWTVLLLVAGGMEGSV